MDLESVAVRLVAAFLNLLGLALGYLVVLPLIPTNGIAWLITAGLVMALGAVLISWRPFMYLVVGWSGLLAACCALLLISLAGGESPVGLALLILGAGALFVAGGALELAVARRPPLPRPTASATVR